MAVGDSQPVHLLPCLFLHPPCPRRGLFSRSRLRKVGNICATERATHTDRSAKLLHLLRHLLIERETSARRQLSDPSVIDCGGRNSEGNKDDKRV